MRDKSAFEVKQWADEWIVPKELYTQEKLIQELQQQIEDMKVCRDHWKASYEARHRVIKDILDFYDRWKGVSQNWNQTLRTKRDREAYKLIKEIVQSQWQSDGMTRERREI